MTEQHFEQPVTQEKWTRFHLLAPRVREARLYRDLHSSMLAELQSTNPRSSQLLPSLSTLTIHSLITGHGLWLPLPLLRELSLTTPRLRRADAPTQKRFFSPISDTHRQICSLSLVVELFNPATVQVIADMLLQLPCLRRVRLNLYDDETLHTGPIGRALASLPNLEDLGFDSYDPAVFQEALTLSAPFPSVRHLKVSASGAADLPTLLKHMSSSITHLIDLQDDSTRGDWKQICLGASHHKILQRLALCGFRDDSLSSDALAPLSALSALSALELYPDGSVDLKDDDIRSLASGLPQLQTLIIQVEVERAFGMSLNAYEIVATLCPAIETVGLPVDATKPALQEVIRPSSTLSIICIWNSPIGDPQAVARFLARLSDAKSFRLAVSHADGSREPKWIEVKDSLPALREAVMSGRK